MAGVALVVLLSLIVFCTYSLAQGIAAIPKALSRDSGTSLSRNDVPQPAKTSGVKDCGANDVALELAAKSATVGVGGSMQFTATIMHKGSTNCLIDASETSRVLTITSGNDTIWRSDVCPVDSRMLLMAQGDKDIQTLTWNTNRSGETCVADADLPKVDRGTYIAKLSLRGDTKISSASVPFVVE